MRTKLARRGVETVRRYFGEELRAKVLEKAEAEVEAAYSRCWADRPAGTWFPRHKQGWQATARKLAQRPPAKATALWWTRRGAIVKAVREAREQPEVWRMLLQECPALASVEFTYKLPEDPTPARHFETVSYLLTYTSIGSMFGPTWRHDRPPTNRDLALQIILSGWVSDGWPTAARDAIKVADAIKLVVAAVKEHRRKHDSMRAASEVTR